MRIFDKLLGKRKSGEEWFKLADDSNDPNEVVKYCTKGLELDSKNVWGWWMKASALYVLKRYDDSLKCFDKAIEIDPKFKNAWYDKGILLAKKLSRFEDALKCFDKVLEIDPKFDDAWHTKANTLGNLNRYEDALKCIEKSLEINPKNADGWAQKGMALMVLNRYEKALECFNKAIEIDPANRNAHFHKERLLSHKKV